MHAINNVSFSLLVKKFTNKRFWAILWHIFHFHNSLRKQIIWSSNCNLVLWRTFRVSLRPYQTSPKHCGRHMGAIYFSLEVISIRKIVHPQHLIPHSRCSGTIEPLSGGILRVTRFQTARGSYTSWTHRSSMSLKSNPPKALLHEFAYSWL